MRKNAPEGAFLSKICDNRLNYMNYRLYTTSVRAWDAMLEAIENAKKSIYLEMYIFLDDTAQSHDFIGKLAEKARSGVRVIVVADAFGSKPLKKETFQTLRSSGAEFIIFSHWLRHIHRKVLIVDESVAFLGGVNIGQRFATWNDLQLELTGRITKSLLKSFAYTYAMAGGKDSKILKYREKKFGYKLRFWIVEHWPIRSIYALKNHYVDKITHAQKSITIVTPYFTPPRWLVSLLDDAVRRGIDVEILIPEQVDWKIMNALNYRYMHDLHHLGVKFFLVENMNHSKLLLIDGQEGLVGSQNIDLLSFQLNTEIGLFFTDKKLIHELVGVISEWKKHAQRFTPKKYKMHFFDYVIFTLVKILRPIL
ncbi:MAG TPA: phosphatidylserine/phosphatidylglycerophosphate/cardiolipin synthase family protein [Patescibacteria group bacterium]